MLLVVRLTERAVTIAIGAGDRPTDHYLPLTWCSLTEEAKNDRIDDRKHPSAGTSAVDLNTIQDLEDWELDATRGGLAPIAAAGAGAVMGAAPEFFNAAVEGRAVNWGGGLQWGRYWSSWRILCSRRSHLRGWVHQSGNCWRYRRVDCWKIFDLTVLHIFPETLSPFMKYIIKKSAYFSLSLAIVLAISNMILDTIDGKILHFFSIMESFLVSLTIGFIVILAFCYIAQTANSAGSSE
ncbi:MAG: hypothetical protein ACK5SX_15570 [Sandaracinobacter sp.]